MKKILIVEDDIALANGLCRALKSDINDAESCYTLNEARKILTINNYDIIILDVNLPDGNGFDFLKEIKSKMAIPVIMLTANDMEADVVAGLESGADDYITKPFSLAVLRARVNTQLRKNDVNNIPKRIKIDNFTFDFDLMEFSFKGNNIELSKTEQKLLHIFVENVGITLTRNVLIDRIWTDGSEYVDENALSVTVNRLRNKLSAQNYIKTIYGVGYVWMKNQN